MYTVITLCHFLNARYPKVLQNAYIQIKLLHTVQISLMYDAIYSIQQFVITMCVPADAKILQQNWRFGRHVRCVLDGQVWRTQMGFKQFFKLNRNLWVYLLDTTVSPAPTPRNFADVTSATSSAAHAVFPQPGRSVTPSSTTRSAANTVCSFTFTCGCDHFCACVMTCCDVCC